MKQTVAYKKHVIYACTVERSDKKSQYRAHYFIAADAKTPDVYVTYTEGSLPDDFSGEQDGIQAALAAAKVEIDQGKVVTEPIVSDLSEPSH